MVVDRDRRLRVVVADDHLAMRRGLCDELADAGFEVCGQAASGSEAVAVALDVEPDLCLLDVVMPGGSGIEAARALHELLPATSVVLISSMPDEDDARAARRAGASGYLAKHDDPRQLPQVLRRAVEDGAAFQSPWLDRTRPDR